MHVGGQLFQHRLPLLLAADQRSVGLIAGLAVPVAGVELHSCLFALAQTANQALFIAGIAVGMLFHTAPGLYVLRQRRQNQRIGRHGNNDA